MAQAAAAPSTQPAGSAPPLPGYYTAYWAQQQHQQPAQQPTAAGTATYPYPTAQPSYPHYPTAPPSAYPYAAVPPPAAATAATAAPPTSTAPSTAAAASSAAATPADAAAAYAKYQEEYARWYNQYYLPHAAYMAQHGQAAVGYPQHATPPVAHYPHAPPTAQQPTAAQPTQPAAANLAPYGYPPPSAASHSQHPAAHAHTLSQPPPPLTTAQPTAPSPRAPLSTDSSKRSRWGATDEPPPSSYAAARSTSSATAASPSSSSSSSSSVAWPPSVIEYVKRSLMHCPAGQRVEVEAWMRDRLQSAVNNGSMHSTDWDREPPAHVRKLAEELTKRHSGAATPHANVAQHAAKHEPAERRNVDEERMEWEERRRREEEEEMARKKRPPFDDGRPAHPRDMRKRLREDEQKSFIAERSSSDDEDDIQHFLSSSYHKQQQLSKRELRKQRKKAKQQQGKASGAGGKSAIWRLDHVDEERNQDRANRFAEYVQQAAATPLRTRIRTDLFTFSAPSSSSAFGGDDEDGDIDWSSLKIVGTSTSLEKSYFRLTSPPSPAVVRPPPILSAALDRLLLLHNSSERTYAYLCDQMKAIRQDLTVQGVKGEVAVRVYEEHARMAIEVGDMSEYNQCQTQLMVLYADKPSRKADAGGLNGTVNGEGGLSEEKEMPASGGDGAAVWENETEFVMYRLCYYLLVNNQPAIASYLRSLTAHQRSLPAIQLVLDLRSAVACDDFHSFLSRYKQTPYMGSTLLQHLCPRMRWLGVQVLLRGYKPTKVEVDVFTRGLAFADDGDCLSFLESCGATLSDDKQFVLTASSELHEPEVEVDEDSEADKHNVTHALLSSIRRKQ